MLAHTIELLTNQELTIEKRPGEHRLIKERVRIDYWGKSEMQSYSATIPSRDLASRRGRENPEIFHP